MTDILLTLCSLIPFYLIGAFPTGRILASRKGVKLESLGSGNVGATNVSRALGKRAGALTLLMDVAKGALAVFIAEQISIAPAYAAQAGLAAVAGHCFSIPGKWRGGKGVATALGVFLVCSPIIAGLGVVTFGLIIVGSKMVSLASITAALLMPVFILLLQPDRPQGVLLPLALICAIVVLRHRSNLMRITEGREAKIGSRAKQNST